MAAHMRAQPAVMPMSVCMTFQVRHDAFPSVWVRGGCSIASNALAEEGAAVERTPEGPRWLCLNRRSVPYILAVSDAIYGLASGCTVKFFSVWWISVSLAPSTVFRAYCLQPLCWMASGAHCPSAARCVLGIGMIRRGWL